MLFRSDKSKTIFPFGYKKMNSNGNSISNNCTFENGSTFQRNSNFSVILDLNYEFTSNIAKCTYLHNQFSTKNTETGVENFYGGYIVYLRLRIQIAATTIFTNIQDIFFPANGKDSSITKGNPNGRVFQLDISDTVDERFVK